MNPENLMTVLDDLLSRNLITDAQHAAGASFDAKARQKLQGAGEPRRLWNAAANVLTHQRRPGALLALENGRHERPGHTREMADLRSALDRLAA